METAEQLKSRSELTAFLESVSKKTRKFGDKIKSQWFGRPDEELKGWIERGAALSEIADTRGYKMILEQTDREVSWAREQLELGKLDATELRMYLRSLRFLHDFILTTERNADLAGTVLAGRSSAIGKDTFVKNATVGERY